MSAWSPRAVWSLGLLQPEDWRGQWIGQDGPPPATLPPCAWIWFPEGKPEISAPLGTRYFRRVFELPADRTVKHAEYQMVADNEFSCWVNGKAAGGGKGAKSISVREIGSLLKPGLNVIAVAAQRTPSRPIFDPHLGSPVAANPKSDFLSLKQFLCSQ